MELIQGETQQKECKFLEGIIPKNRLPHSHIKILWAH